MQCFVDTVRCFRFRKITRKIPLEIGSNVVALPWQTCVMSKRLTSFQNLDIQN